MIIPVDQEIGELRRPLNSKIEFDSEKAKLLEQKAAVQRQAGLIDALERAVSGMTEITRGISLANPVTLPGNAAVALDRALGLVPSNTELPFQPGRLATYAVTGEPILEVPKLDEGVVKEGLARLGWTGQGPRRLSDVLTGVQRSAADFGDFLLTPEGLSLPFTGAASSLAKLPLALGFGTQMSTTLPEAASIAGERSVEGGPEAVRALVNMILQGVLPAGIASGLAVKGLQPDKPLPFTRVFQPTEEAGYRLLGMQTELAQKVGAQKRSEAGAVMPTGEEGKQPSLSAETPFFLRNQKESGFNPQAKVDSTQLLNRLKNKLTPGEFLSLQESGLEEFLKEGKKTPSEVAEWVEKRGPKVEVRELFASEKVDPLQRELSNLKHELETLPYASLDFDLSEARFVPQVTREGERYVSIRGRNVNIRDKSLLTHYGVSPELMNKMDRYVELVERGVSLTAPKFGESATARYTAVNPKPLEEMPGAVDLLVKVPLSEDKGILYESDHYPQEGSNLLVHVRGYMETLPDGRKVFRVFELQSDWAQEFREGRHEVPNHPLLKHYERLGLKAAIDHARKEGADAIAIDDAETAMITEGHDRISTQVFPLTVTDVEKHYGGTEEPPSMFGDDWKEGTYVLFDDNVYRVDKLEANTRTIRTPEGTTVPKSEIARELVPYAQGGDFIPQEKGMRLHYDQTLPKIASELTGERGENVEFGEHKNAQPDPTFKNPDGSFKVTSTGRLYSIKNTRKSFSLFESDKVTKEGEQNAKRIRSNERPPYENEGDVGKKKVYQEAGSDTSREGLQQPAPGRSDALETRQGEDVRGIQARISPRAGEAGFIRLPRFLRARTDRPILGPDVLPDFDTHKAENQKWAEKFAWERVPVMGSILGGKYRIKSPEEEAVAAWFGVRHGVGPSVASAVGARIKGEVNDAFGYGKVGAPVPGFPNRKFKKGDLNVQPTQAGASLKTSDVLEELQRNPTSYILTPDQQRVWSNVLGPVVGRMSELVKKYNLVELMDEYFMRVVTKLPNRDVRKGTGSRVGAKQRFQRERIFSSEEEGWTKGVEYAQDVELRLVQGIQSLYRAIADKRLSQDPILGGQTRGQVVAALTAAYPSLARDQIRRMANSVQAQGSVYSPAFFGKIYSPRVAQVLNREFAAEQSSLRKSLANANATTKAIMLGFDWGVGQLQLLPTAFNRPDIWAKAQFYAMGAFLSPDVFPKYVERNWDVILELVKNGSSVGRLEEYMTGMGQGGFARHFQTALDVAKVELWKAWRDVTPKDKQLKVIQGIESTLLSGRMESGMVPHNRALLERTFLLAPSYYRGAVNFIGALGESGVSGDIARRAMGRFILGSAALFYGVGKAIGMSDDELLARFNPGNPYFMNWSVRLKEGSRPLEVGLGGIMHSFLKLSGDLIAFARKHPREWNTLSVYENPLSRWYRSHAGPVIGWTMNALFGKDFLGRESTITGGILDLSPLALQSGSKEEASLRMVGLSTKPARSPSAEQIVKKLFPGKEVEELSIPERRKLAKEVERQAYPRTREETKLAAERALRYSLERRENLERVLSKESREFLNKNGLDLPGYQTGQTFAKQRVNFTEKEKEWFFNEVAIQYELALDRLRGQEGFDSLTKEAKEIRLQRVLEAARAKAQGNLARQRKRQFGQ